MLYSIWTYTTKHDCYHLEAEPMDAWRLREGVSNRCSHRGSLRAHEALARSGQADRRDRRNFRQDRLGSHTLLHGVRRYGRISTLRYDRAVDVDRDDDPGGDGSARVCGRGLCPQT